VCHPVRRPIPHANDYPHLTTSTTIVPMGEINEEKHDISVTEGAKVATMHGMTAEKPGATTKSVFNVSTATGSIAGDG
jgi:hypothetical protein